MLRFNTTIPMNINIFKYFVNIYTDLFSNGECDNVSIKNFKSVNKFYGNDISIKVIPSDSKDVVNVELIIKFHTKIENVDIHELFIKHFSELRDLDINNGKIVVETNEGQDLDGIATKLWCTGGRLYDIKNGYKLVFDDDNFGSTLESIIICLYRYNRFL